MSIKENKALVRRVVEFWNRRDLDAFFKVLSPEYVEHLPSGDVTLEQLKKYADNFFTAFPDIEIIIKDMVAEGDKVAVLVNWQATHRGEYLGIPATGKRVSFGVIDIMRFADGVVVEHWGQMDSMGMMQQLGVVPAPGEGGG